MLATLWLVRHEDDRALLTYTDNLLRVVVLLLCLSPAFLIAPPRRLARGFRFVSIPVTAFFASAFLVGMFTGRLEDLPGPIALPAQAFFAAKQAKLGLDEREPLVYESAVSPRIDKIVLVMDEAIRGDFLQLPGPRRHAADRAQRHNVASYLVIYTSDHGQALYDGHYEATNCSGPGAAMGEGIVPLIVIGSGGEVAFHSSAKLWSNRGTHADIFPTILWALGIDPTLVNPPYERGLLGQPPARQRRFFVDSPFQTAMQWVDVN